VRLVQAGVDVREAEAEPAEVVEDVPVHEGRPAAAGLVPADGVVVDVAVLPVGKEPERHVAEHVAVTVEHPHLVGVLREEVAVLGALPLLPRQLRP
jgi:hypothetical protein